MPPVGSRYSAEAGRQRAASARIGLLLLTALFGLSPPAAVAQPCAADRIDERVRVSFVQDGDTLMLSDGQRLRLIGINTPELSRNGNAAQAGAIAARDQLRQLIFSNQQRLDLRFDKERHDRYGRLLAHGFFSDGSNVVEQLLTAGAGTQLVVPPNTWQASCYTQAVRGARQQHKGIWALTDYRPTPVEQLSLRSEGFHIVRGRVGHVSDSAQAIWINLTGNLALRIEREDLTQFPGFDPDGLVGREIEAQGWLYASRGQLIMRLRHPAALEMLAHQPPAAGSGTVE